MKAYALPREHLKLDKQETYAVRHNIVAAISFENGLESLKVFAEPIDSDLYTSIVPDLLRFGPNLCIFSDNVSYHTSLRTNKVLDKAKIYQIQNVPYVPDLNPIEKCFLAAKTRYKALRLNAILTGRKATTEDLILQAFSQITKKAIQRNVEKTRGLMRLKTLEEVRQELEYKM